MDVLERLEPRNGSMHPGTLAPWGCTVSAFSPRRHGNPHAQAAMKIGLRNDSKTVSGCLSRLPVLLGRKPAEHGCGKTRSRNRENWFGYRILRLII